MVGHRASGRRNQLFGERCARPASLQPQSPRPARDQNSIGGQSGQSHPARVCSEDGRCILSQTLSGRHGQMY